MSAAAEPLLADVDGAPECMKVRACLQLKGVPFRRTTAAVAAPWRLPDFPDVGRPVLYVDDRSLVGAAAIVAWLERAVPTPPLLPADDAARAYCRMLEQWADDVLGALVTAATWSDADTAGPASRRLASEIAPGPFAGVVAWRLRRQARRRLRGAVADVAARLETALADVEAAIAGRRYLLGDALTVADVALAVQLVRLEALSADRRLPVPGTTTRAWRDRLDAIDALRTALRP